MPLARLRQVHSNRCLAVASTTLPPGGVAGDGDALATAGAGLALGVATADCVPLIAVDPAARSLAVVHAGWRGTLSGVLASALRCMIDEMGARPERIVVAAGPAAGACCYQVGDDVTAAFRRERPGHADRVIILKRPGVAHVDLIEANRLQAADAGVDPARFDSLGVCTICSPNTTHSYRRDGAAAGRMWALAMLV